MDLFWSVSARYFGVLLRGRQRIRSTSVWPWPAIGPSVHDVILDHFDSRLTVYFAYP